MVFTRPWLARTNEARTVSASPLLIRPPQPLTLYRWRLPPPRKVCSNPKLSSYLKRTSPLPAVALVPSRTPLHVKLLSPEKVAWIPTNAPYVRPRVASYRTARKPMGEKVTLIGPLLGPTVQVYGPGKLL